MPLKAQPHVRVKHLNHVRGGHLKRNYQSVDQKGHGNPQTNGEKK